MLRSLASGVCTGAGVALLVRRLLHARESETSSPRDLVAVTGAAGNLGSKLIAALLREDPEVRILAMDRATPAEATHPHATHPRVEWVHCDLSNASDLRWRAAVARATAIVHFAAKNPYPEADWADATTSLDMSCHVLLAASRAPRMRRVVFASSNHVMGRYKETGACDPARKITPELTPGVGTVWYPSGEGMGEGGTLLMDSTVYAVPKLASERLCKALAAEAALRHAGPSFVCVRIGWCQPGENSAATLNATGTPTQEAVEGEGADGAPADGAPANVDTLRNVPLLTKWFQSMWLSNRDFAQIFRWWTKASLGPDSSKRCTCSSTLAIQLPDLSLTLSLSLSLSLFEFNQ